MAVSPFDLAYAGASYFGDIAVWAYCRVAVLAALAFERHGGAGRCLLAAVAVWIAFRGKEIGPLVVVPPSSTCGDVARRAAAFAATVAAVLAADALFATSARGSGCRTCRRFTRCSARRSCRSPATRYSATPSLFRGDVFGWFPHVAVASAVVRTVARRAREREVAFVVPWMALFVAGSC